MATHTPHSIPDALLSGASDAAATPTKTVNMPIGIPDYTLHEEDSAPYPPRSRRCSRSTRI